MRALLAHSVGTNPQASEIDRPAASDEILVEMLAARINPVDRAIAAGTFYGGHPPLPFILGTEGVGRVVAGSAEPGTLVWVTGDGLGMSRQGTFAEYVVAPPNSVCPLGRDGDPFVAAGLGIPAVTAWQALVDRGGLREGSRVLVLGATGAVGTAALRIAAAAGASMIVAAGRDASALEASHAHGASGTALINGDAAQIADSIRKAFGGEGPDLVIDPLCGIALEASVAAASPGATIVQLGQALGPSATLSSAAIRGKQLDIRGYSIFATTTESRTTAMNALMSLTARTGWVPQADIVTMEHAAQSWPAPGNVTIDLQAKE